MTSNTYTILISPDELNLDYTLAPGQSFRWKCDESGRWIGVVKDKVIRIWRDEYRVRYQIFPDDDDESIVPDYFHLDVNLGDLYKSFIEADEYIKLPIEKFKGLRVLKQDPTETLFSYICSSANSVARISSAVERLSTEMGTFIARIDGVDYFSFPTPNEIIKMDINHISKVCNMGFRCKNIHYAAKYLLEKPGNWLISLRHADYEEARSQLMEIEGIGMKIADCILLFSLDKNNAVPVDTHIRKIATTHYMPEFKQKSLTKSVYEEISRYFQTKFGEYAGWAQEYLFYYDLLYGTCE